jgi:hypothetical protein
VVFGASHLAKSFNGVEPTSPSFEGSASLSASPASGNERSRFACVHQELFEGSDRLSGRAIALRCSSQTHH